VPCVTSLNIANVKSHLADTGWLPEPLRTPTAEIAALQAAAGDGVESLPAFLADEPDVTAPPGTDGVAAE
jgi:hypothetical protein